MICKQSAPPLPCLAIEQIQRHLWQFQRFQGPDARRDVIIRVNKQWKRALELAKGVWDEITILDSDLWPRLGSEISFDATRQLTASRIVHWLQNKTIKRLSIDLHWNEKYCRAEDLEITLVGVLLAVHDTIETLSIKVTGAPLAAGHVWMQAAQILKSSSSIQTFWPRLKFLELLLDGKGAPSPAHAAFQASRVADTLKSIPSLRDAHLTFEDVNIVMLPSSLKEASQLEELSLRFTSAGGSAQQPRGPLLPIKRSGLLPLPPNLKYLLLEDPFSCPDHLISIIPKICQKLERFELSSPSI